MHENLKKQQYQNCMAFIIIYTLTGIMVGLIYDILVTYLMAISPAAAKGMASYMGAAAFAASALVALVPKLGYKKIMLSVPVITAASLLLIAYSGDTWIITTAVFLLITGTTIFDVILAPFIAVYTTAAERTSFFTKTSYANVAGIILGTLTGGPMIVWIFSKQIGIGYNAAKLLTSSIESLSLAQFSSYIASYRSVLLGFAAVSALMLIPMIGIKESPEDYKLEPAVKNNRNSGFAPLMNKYVLLFLAYTILGGFAASLFVPNVSIYLTDIGINRAAVSMLGMLQYLAILIFMPFSTWITGKIGKVNTVALICFVSVPFMLILANGYKYGNNVELIVGAALFFRAGLANASVPVVNSLTMELVSKEHRALYASLVFVMRGLAQIAAGFFTKYYLFNTAHGYAGAYYYAATLYIAAHVMLLAVFSKKYNRVQDLQC
ncbi:MAG: MFS transporter [Caulobacteraceae bacterium]